MMKQFNFLCLTMFFIGILPSTYATVHTILVGQSGLTFSPSSITTVAVGDVIRWTWLSGAHTSTSVSIPSGAATWDVSMFDASNDFDYNVTTAGVCTYECNPHSGSGMTGSFTVSGATSVHINSLIYGSLVLIPNPAVEQVQLKFNSDRSFKALMILFDARGNEKKRKTIDVLAGDNEFVLNISDLSKGAYIINIVDGTTPLVARKFIKE